MNNQEQLNFNQLNLPTEEEAEKLKESFGNEPGMDIFIDEYTDKIKIGDKFYKRTPDPEGSRKLNPPNKPIVLYCNTRYFLINSAKLQAVKDLRLIVGISQKLGKKLLKEHHQSKIEADNERSI